MPYDVAQAVGQVRLLCNDIDSLLFTDDEIQAFLTMEGAVVKLAAAQALDTIASNEAMVLKVIRTQDLSTDGAKLADALYKRAALLRDQAAAELELDTGFAFEIAEFGGCTVPELTEPAWGWYV